MWVPNCPCLIYHHRTDDGAGKDQRARSSTDTARGGFVGTVMMHLLPIYPSRRQRVSFVPGERILGSAPTEAQVLGGPHSEGPQKTARQHDQRWTLTSLFLILFL